MNRYLRAMSCVAASAIAAVIGVPAGAAAAPRDNALEARLRTHIQVLASDDYGGRQPGTEGEAKTLRYLAAQWFDIGLVSGTNEPGNPWFAPVKLVGHEPAASNSRFTRQGQAIPIPAGLAQVYTSGARSLVQGAPFLFVGTGKAGPPPRAELAGRIAVLLEDGSVGSERQTQFLQAGAAAVITVLDGTRTLADVAAQRRAPRYTLASEAVGGDLEGFITPAGLDRLLGPRSSTAALAREAARPGFAPRLLDVSASLEATTRQTTIQSFNLIGRLPGRRPEAGAVLFMAHWDHFGTCGDGGAADRICNGAIDNASGLAGLTEIARRLSKGPQLDRDIYFVATTAEEMGLLGTYALADDPPVPLGQIVAAFNIDMIALAPAGTPFGVVGRGMTRLDPFLEAAAKANRRTLAPGTAANAYVKRQDGWALIEHDVPAVQVSTAYGDPARVERFFAGAYHGPKDEFGPALELGGAVEDVLFLTALGRWFADPRRVPLAK